MTEAQVVELFGAYADQHSLPTTPAEIAAALPQCGETGSYCEDRQNGMRAQWAFEAKASSNSYRSRRITGPPNNLENCDECACLSLARTLRPLIVLARPISLPVSPTSAAFPFSADGDEAWEASSGDDKKAIVAVFEDAASSLRTSRSGRTETP